jgi:hypothetical protein|tara:strand:- start:1028 stop:1372 length:345 start_codon:yes stop_codon:yes gene_type:complete
MQDFDIFESFKKETDRSFIAKMKVTDGEAVLVHDEFNLFGEPFVSEHSNGWLKVNFPYSLSAESIKIKKIQAIFLARTFIIGTALHSVIPGNTPWYTHPIFRKTGDDLNIKIYG